MARKSSGAVPKSKYEEMIRSEVNQILRSKLGDPRLQFVSVISVELSKDYSHAKLYWDTFDLSKKDDIHDAIGSCATKVKSLLAKSLPVRQIPSLHFFYDGQFEAQNEIENILKDEAKSGKGF